MANQFYSTSRLRRTFGIVLLALALCAGSFPTAIVAAENAALIHTSQPGAAAMADITFSPVFLTGLEQGAWWNSSLVVDSTGGLHSAFYDADFIYYAYCPSSCEKVESWQTLQLAGTGQLDSLDMPVVKVDSQNRPRMGWWYKDAQGNYQYAYGECNTGCTSLSNWQVLDLPSEALHENPQTNHYFAVDRQGRAHFTATEGSGFWYAVCEQNCGSAASWGSVFVDMNYKTLYLMQIALTPTGQPRLMGQDGNNALYYLQCDANCLQPESWSYLSLYNMGYSSEYSFRVDSQGRPRLLYTDKSGANPMIYYAWSDANSTTAEGWSRYDLELNVPGEDLYGNEYDLQFDSQDRPHIAYTSKELDLAYAYCDSGCQTQAPNWLGQKIETGEQLNDRANYPPDPGFLVANWFVGYVPSLALDVDGRPYVSYYVRNAQADSRGEIYYRYSALRVAIPADSTGPVTPGDKKVYLPLTIR